MTQASKNSKDRHVIGAQIGTYRVLRQIGEGGMGAVWLAEHVMLGRQVAIKVLHRETSQKPDIIARFFNEAKAATAISDPGIVQIFDFGHHSDGNAYIVMELLEGEALDRRLQRLRTLPLASALRILRQVAGSLGVAHQRGIVHRDVKPENIFL
ncbi:MAG TPA: serine/threonine-protein kinase, partial [Kofleriaceae bacterium]|nr:serine/threonine-protein kinase [Kofleriaceae bacterium]